MRDPVRQKHVADTPEERVRQALIRLLKERGIPGALLAVEKSVRVQGAVRRPDIVVHDREGKPWMVVECKAPNVHIAQQTLDQVANYNRSLGAPFVLVSNGVEHYCARVDQASMIFLEDLPAWPDR
jgi:type I site-specific restriction endonuclease